MMNTIVYLNGEYVPLNQAKVSVMDRGFLFGDGIYEVIPCFNGQLFLFEEHIRRLEDSLNAIRLEVPFSLADWREIFENLIEKNSGEDLRLYLQITRGVTETRNHALPTNITPTIFARSTPFTPTPFEELEKGIKAITLMDTRWNFCHIKSTSLLANILLYQQALDVHAAEAILLHEGHAIEGSSSNIFVIKDGLIMTTPLNHKILGGITRDLILNLAKKHGIPYKETMITENQLRNADEIWISSSSREIRPVITLDDKSVGKGKTGPLWRDMYKYYQEFKNTL